MYLAPYLIAAVRKVILSCSFSTFAPFHAILGQSAKRALSLYECCELSAIARLLLPYPSAARVAALEHENQFLIRVVRRRRRTMIVSTAASAMNQTVSAAARVNSVLRGILAAGGRQIGQNHSTCAL